MIYKFKSKAAGDLIMLGPQGDLLLGLLGRAPARQGIIEVADMPSAMAALQAAVLAQEAQGEDDGEMPAGAEPRVTLSQRLWPMIQLLKQAQAAGEPIVWGV